MRHKIKHTSDIMYKRTIQLSLGILLCTVFGYSNAYAQEGSMTVENSKVNIAGGTTEQRFSKETYFGPEADWTIDGTLEIWSEKIWIATDANIQGNGKIIIHNPGSNPFYPDAVNTATIIDGNNNNFIKLLVEHRNSDNAILDDIQDPGYDTFNPPGADAARFNMGAELQLAEDGANIILNGHDLGFDAAGTITEHNAKRMVVTSNSITGHVLKEYADRETFVFPVGIEEGDYTPAAISPQGKGTFYVSVQDYAGSNTRMEDRELGMDRSWHIYALDEAQADLVLTHNNASDGRAFEDDKAQVAQYSGGTDWDLLETDNMTRGVHRTMNAEIVANQIESGIWFTKHAEVMANFFIPNVFTPNGDGSFDTFIITGLENYDSADVTIFNRWGNEVYRNRNYENNWDGHGLNEGTYYYLIEMEKDGKREVYKGWVLLKR